MDNIMQARCENCGLYKPIKWEWKGGGYGWCRLNEKHNPNNPYDDGYECKRFGDSCDNFTPKGVDDEKPKCKWFEPKGATNE